MAVTKGATHKAKKTSLVQTLVNSAAYKYSNSTRPYVEFGICGSINYIIPYFMWSHDSDFHDPAFALRIWASIMCFFLLLGHSLLENNVKKYFLPIYWYCTLVYSLPFISTYALFAGHFATTWILSSALSIFILALVADWISFVSLMVVGSLAGYLTYLYAAPPGSQHYIKDNILLTVYVHFFSVLIGAFFLYQKAVMFAAITAAQQKIAKLNAGLEETVQRRTDYLKRALNAKTEFLNNISHEVRTPLQSIMGISSSLVSDWANLQDDEKLHYTKIVADSGNRLITLVSNLLDLSKFDSGKMLFDMGHNNLTDAIEDVVDDMSPVADMKNIPIHFKVESDADYNIICDKTRIQQLIRNLLSNAIKYTDHGEIKVVISETTTDKWNIFPSTRAIKIEIHDTGIGIPESEVKSIFLPFTQSSKTKTKAGGTGLGLAISMEIIIAHHGKIWAENNKNGGATFFIVLPDLQYNENMEIVHTSINPSKDNSLFLNKKVLFIDDEESCLVSGSMILQSAGFIVSSVDGGIKAIEALKNEKFDMVLLDIMMPDMTGLEVLAVMQKTPEWKNIPVIMQSGAADTREIRNAIQLGAQNCVIKPYNREQILTVIREVLTNRVMF